MALTNAQKQAAHRLREKAKLAELQKRANEPRPEPPPVSNVTGPFDDCTPEEVAYLTRLLKTRRTKLKTEQHVRDIWEKCEADRKKREAAEAEMKKERSDNFAEELRKKAREEERKCYAHSFGALGNPYVGLYKVDLQRIISANHPDKGIAGADLQKYQWAIEAKDLLRAA